MRVASLSFLLLLGADYYVAQPPTGNDRADGSMFAPWATLQHAADQAQPGDSITVGPGDYAGFYLDRSGTSLAPIIFRAELGVTISLPNGTTPDGINLEGASFIVVEGFTASGMPRAGFRAVQCEHVSFFSNRADLNTSWGILTAFCDDLVIEGNVTSRSMVEHGIYVSNSGDRPVLRRNRVWGNHANGIHMNGDLSQGGDGVISGALVEGNVIWDNGTAGGSGINCDGVQDSVIRNNLLYDNKASGISLYQIDGGGGSTGNLVINNTIIMATSARWALNVQGPSSGNTALNNILLNRDPVHGSIDVAAAAEPLTSDYNIVADLFSRAGAFIDLATWRADTGQDAHSLVVTAADLFVDETGNDYHLATGSMAIDRGTEVMAPPMDIEGTARPQGVGFDIGAYEACLGETCVTGPPADANRPPFDEDGGFGNEDGGKGGGDSSGCGCRVGGSTPRVPTIVLLVLAVLFPAGGGRRRGPSR